MSSQNATTAKGLEGIIIGETNLSKVDGQIGKLQYHGYNIMDLAEYALFEEVVYLLWNLKLPTRGELDGLHTEIVKYQKLRPEIIEMMKLYPKDAHPMAVLRSAVSAEGMFDPNAEDNSDEENRRKAAILVAMMPTVVAAWERIRAGEDPIDPRDDLYLAANFLYMMQGREPTETEAKAINSYLVLLADHGINASTFSSRVTTSTLSDMYSAVTSAIGTLKGPAHGGANQKAMEQFMSVGGSDKVDAWFDNLMETGGRIMGIGHRVYKAPDPRGTVLRGQAEALATGEAKEWYDIAYMIEQRARAHEFFIERSLYPNVDYYSAIVLYQVGIPVDQFTTLFAMSRIAGWSAHVMEQWKENRLIRPRAEYVGPEDQAWVAVDDRS